MMIDEPTAVIADDEPHLRRHLRVQLEQAWPELQIVGEAADGETALDLIRCHGPSIAFLDIQMPSLSGLDVAKAVLGSPTRLVFATAYDEFAVAAFELHAVDYLLKPVTTERLARCLDHLRSQMRSDGLTEALKTIAANYRAPEASNHLRYVKVAVGEEMRMIPIAEVAYFRASDKYTIVCADPSESRELLLRTSLGEILRQLDHDRFWQIHRGVIVNLDFVSGTRKDGLGRLWATLKDRLEELPISRAYAGRFKPS